MHGNSESTSQPLKDMLKYIQESTNDNVTNQDLASIQEMVEKVKHRKEVDLSYMKSWEYEEMIHDEAMEAGYQDGFNDGMNKGTDRLNQLILLLTQAGRTEDIPKSALDKEYQQKLFEEFGL